MLLGALIFLIAGIAGILLARRFCSTVSPFDDGPVPAEPPVVALVGGSALLGASIGFHGLPLIDLALFAVVAACLVACWCTDMRCGLLPDAFTLGPLLLILGLAIWQHQLGPVVSAAALFVPFAAAAMLSRGRGMGWGDVKLVALGAALLGAPMAMLAFAGACIAAVLINRANVFKRDAPIAFAPYLVAAIGGALPVALAFR